jgi:hypothetical protein
MQADLRDEDVRMGTEMKDTGSPPPPEGIEVETLV